MGITLEWFSRLSTGIKTWGELANKFVEHFTFNIENEITISTLCYTTQEEGEKFVTFFQQWGRMASQCLVEIPKKKKVAMLIENLN